MKSFISTKIFITAAVIFTSLSAFSAYTPTKNYESVFAKAQLIIESLSDIQDIKNLPKEDKAYLKDIYVLELKSGKIAYAPKTSSGKDVLTQSEALDIVIKTVKAWQTDESKTVYTIDKNLASIVVTNSRDVYVLVIPGAHLQLTFAGKERLSKSLSLFQYTNI